MLILEHQFTYSVPIAKNRQPSVKLVKKNAILTYYWVVFESNYPGPKTVELKTCSNKRIALVNARFAKDIHIKFPFGAGETGNPLEPFITLAANDLKTGTKIYLKEFDGLRLPINNKIHNGCFKIGDTGFSLGKNHIDVFVLKEKFYEKIDAKINRERINVVTKDCKLLNYGPFK
ncbi:10471_t:CDS:2 [Entrophospora sp. SA101]|nr:10471_t:CDS:2 [Entrophospora sp. SA101]